MAAAALGCGGAAGGVLVPPREPPAPRGVALLCARLSLRGGKVRGRWHAQLRRAHASCAGPQRAANSRARAGLVVGSRVAQTRAREALLAAGARR